MKNKDSFIFKSMGAMGDGRSSPKRSGNDYYFGNLCLGCACIAGFVRVKLDTVGTLGCKCYR